jgi:hypothetical protein
MLTKLSSDRTPPYANIVPTYSIVALDSQLYAGP